MTSDLGDSMRQYEIACDMTARDTETRTISAWVIIRGKRCYKDEKYRQHYVGDSMRHYCKENRYNERNGLRGRYVKAMLQ